MEDNLIIELYFQRTEQAIDETRLKYSRLLRSIALNILKNMEDAEECENDTYLKTWNSIPPERPVVLSAFLSKIARNLSLDKYEYLHARKRGKGEIPALLDELEECLPDGSSIFENIEVKELTEIIDRFLGSLKGDARNIFMRRYWFSDSIQDIAKATGFSMSKVKMNLMRTRNGLKAVLEKEGYGI